MVGTWGVSGYAAKASYLSFFPLGLRAIGNVLHGKRISFPVTPKDRQSGRFLYLVRPQLAVLGLTFAGAVWAAGALALGGTGHTLTAVVTNLLWGLNNCFAMAGIIAASLWQPPAPLDGSLA
jgi:cellulose synthase (UDP-forming)